MLVRIARRRRWKALMGYTTTQWIDEVDEVKRRVTSDECMWIPQKTELAGKQDAATRTAKDFRVVKTRSKKLPVLVIGRR